MRILIVEDNEDSRNLLMKQLRAYGHDVIPATDGVEALQQALEEVPDILISDIIMPKMDGYQLCQEWKHNDKLKDIPFIFYTATYTADEDERFALSLRATSFIRKPTKPDVLVQRLSEIVEKTQSGALAPAKVAPLEPSLFLIEYNKRIVARLEEKMAELEAEITERKQAKERLKESEERYRSTLDNMLESCQIIGYDWCYLYVNDAVARHGHQAKETLLGHTMMEIYPSTKNTEMFAALRNCMEKRIPHRMENEFTFLDGAKGWFELSIEPVPDGIFILSLDIDPPP